MVDYITGPRYLQCEQSQIPVVSAFTTRRSVAALFVLLYAYNFAGYLVLVLLAQEHIREDVRAALRGGAPEAALVTLVLPSPADTEDAAAIQWIGEDEVRCNGSLYDIVRRYSSGDSTYLICLSDAEEDELLADFDDHVRRQLGASGDLGEFDEFMDVFKDSYTHRFHAIHSLVACGIVSPVSLSIYCSVDLDVPSPPPRS